MSFQTDFQENWVRCIEKNETSFSIRDISKQSHWKSKFLSEKKFIFSLKDTDGRVYFFQKNGERLDLPKKDFLKEIENVPEMIIYPLQQSKYDSTSEYREFLIIGSDSNTNLNKPVTKREKRYAVNTYKKKDTFQSVFKRKWENCILEKKTSFVLNDCRIQKGFSGKYLAGKQFVYCFTDAFGAKMFCQTRSGRISVPIEVLSLTDVIPEIEIFPLENSVFDNTILYETFLLYRFMIQNKINVLGGGLGSEIEANPKLLNRLLINRHEDNLKLLEMGIQNTSEEAFNLANRALEATAVQLDSRGNIKYRPNAFFPVFSGHIIDRKFKIEASNGTVLLPLLSERQKDQNIKMVIEPDKLQKYVLSDQYIRSLINGTYLEAINALKKKYGTPPKPYFATEEFKSVNKNNRFLKEGLYIHHDAENKYILLARPDVARKFSYKWQQPNKLTYCNFLEHMILHLLIFKETKELSKKSDNQILGLGGLVDFQIPFEGNPALVAARRNEYMTRGKGESQLFIKANEQVYFEILKQLAKEIIGKNYLTVNEKEDLLMKIVTGGLSEPIEEISDIVLSAKKELDMQSISKVVPNTTPQIKGNVSRIKNWVSKKFTGNNF